MFRHLLRSFAALSLALSIAGTAAAGPSSSLPAARRTTTSAARAKTSAAQPNHDDHGPSAHAGAAHPAPKAQTHPTTTTTLDKRLVSKVRPRGYARAALGDSPKLVVFDWDGTLGDTYPQLRYIVTHSAHDAGLGELKSADGSDPYRPIIDGAGLEVMFRRMAPHGTPEQEKKFVDAFKVHTATAPLTLLKLKPGIAAEIKALREKHPDIKLAILSSRPQDVVEQLAEHAGLTHVFSKIVGTGGSGIAEKPAPDGLHVISHALGIAPKDSVMIGDTPMDVGAGKAAGMHTVALRDGMGTPSKLAEAKADITLDRLPGFASHVIPTKAAPRSEAVAQP